MGAKDLGRACLRARVRAHKLGCRDTRCVGNCCCRRWWPTTHSACGWTTTDKRMCLKSAYLRWVPKARMGHHLVSGALALKVRWRLHCTATELCQCFSDEFPIHCSGPGR